jgi:hypothetical protein
MWNRLFLFILATVSAVAQTVTPISNGLLRTQLDANGQDIVRADEIKFGTANDVTLGRSGAGALTLTGNLSVTGTVDFPSGSVAWADVNKTGSSLADLVTRSAADLSSGILDNARLDADLAAIGALPTTSYGRGLLTFASRDALAAHLTGDGSGAPYMAGLPLEEYPLLVDGFFYWDATGGPFAQVRSSGQVRTTLGLSTSDTVQFGTVQLTGEIQASGLRMGIFSNSLLQPSVNTNVTATMPTVSGTLLTTTGNGSGLTALNATSISSGTVDNARLDADVAALGNNATSGFWARTGAGTGAARTIAGTANQITVTNGDGVAGAPTLSIPTNPTLPGTVSAGGLDLPTDGSSIRFANTGSNGQLTSAAGTLTLSNGAGTAGADSLFIRTANDRNVVVQPTTGTTGTFKVNYTNASTSTTTGALTVAGGAGVAGTLNAANVSVASAGFLQMPTTAQTTEGRAWYTSDTLRFRGSSGERTLVDQSLTQTLSNKTLSAPAITGTTSSSGMIESTAVRAAGIAALSASSATPAFHLRETDATANNQRWDIQPASGTLQFRLIPDDDLSAANWMTVARSGTTPGTTTLLATTASTNKDTGALVVEGGLGVEGTAWVGGSLGVGNSSGTNLQIDGANRTITTDAIGPLIIRRGGNFSGITLTDSAGAGTGRWTTSASQPHMWANQGGSTTYAQINNAGDFQTSFGRVVKTNVVTGNTTLDATYHTVICNSASALTLTLPAAASNTGREYRIKNRNTGTVTVSGANIDGAASLTLSVQYQSVILVSDGTEWGIY